MNSSCPSRHRSYKCLTLNLQPPLTSHLTGVSPTPAVLPPAVGSWTMIQLHGGKPPVLFNSCFYERNCTFIQCQAGLLFVVQTHLSRGNNLIIFIIIITSLWIFPLRKKKRQIHVSNPWPAHVRSSGWTVVSWWLFLTDHFIHLLKCEEKAWKILIPFKTGLICGRYCVSYEMNSWILICL